MLDAFDVPPPRPRTIVERWSAPARRRVRRLSWILTCTFIVIALGGSGIVVAGSLSSAAPSDDALQMCITAVVASVVFVGLLPSYAVRRVLMRDVRAVDGIVRDGVRCSGHVTSHERMALGGMHLLQIMWNEDDATATASFDIEKLESDLPVGAAVTVLARPGIRSVGAIIDETLYVGLRPRGRQ